MTTRFERGATNAFDDALDETRRALRELYQVSLSSHIWRAALAIASCVSRRQCASYRGKTKLARTMSRRCSCTRPVDSFESKTPAEPKFVPWPEPDNMTKKARRRLLPDRGWEPRQACKATAARTRLRQGRPVDIGAHQLVPTPPFPDAPHKKHKAGAFALRRRLSNPHTVASMLTATKATILPRTPSCRIAQS